MKGYKATDLKKCWFKVLGEDSKPCHGGSGEWSLPKGKRPGKWMPKIKDIEPCSRGYHIVKFNQLRRWLNAEIWICEWRGGKKDANDKSVVSECRLIKKVETWDKKARILFAADCAEHVLKIYEDKYPNDPRPRNAIEAARQYARGLIGLDAAYASAASAASAAYSAAYAATYAANAATYAANAATYAANAATYAANSAYSAANSATYAATYAANAAANAATYAAAGDKEIEWQNKRLMQYLTGELNEEES